MITASLNVNRSLTGVHSRRIVNRSINLKNTLTITVLYSLEKREMLMLEVEPSYNRDLVIDA